MPNATTDQRAAAPRFEELLARAEGLIPVLRERAPRAEELRRLPEKYRVPILLCYWEGKTRDEAAQQIGLTSDAFKKRLEQARNLLKSRLARRGLAAENLERHH